MQRRRSFRKGCSNVKREATHTTTPSNALQLPCGSDIPPKPNAVKKPTGRASLNLLPQEAFSPPAVGEPPAIKDDVSYVLTPRALTSPLPPMLSTLRQSGQYHLVVRAGTSDKPTHSRWNHSCLQFLGHVSNSKGEWVQGQNQNSHRRSHTQSLSRN
jgi:hypothetical protein